MNEFAQLEAEAERKAANHVANMLHTPDKLEKVQLFMSKIYFISMLTLESRCWDEVSYV